MKIWSFFYVCNMTQLHTGVELDKLNRFKCLVQCENVISKILKKLEDFQEGDSGWALHKIISLGININKYEIGTGGATYNISPDQTLKKQACINVKNDDEKCFAWAIVSALYPL